MTIQEAHTPDLEFAREYQPPWRIRRLPDELFPWQVYRRTGAATVDYEPLMRCSTFEGAHQLVWSLIWLSRQPLLGTLHG